MAFLHMHPVQRHLFSLGLCPQRQLQAKVLVTAWLCADLGCWQDPADILRGNMLGPVLCCQVVSADVSLEGWGALSEGRGTSVI